MEATQSRCLFLFFLFTCKLPPGVAAEIQESPDGPGATQGPVRLTDVPAAMEFIAAAEVAVIGFFQDLEIPAVSVFHGVVQKFQDVSFGVSTDPEVLAHYNITENTISLFRLKEVYVFNTNDDASIRDNDKDDGLTQASQTDAVMKWKEDSNGNTGEAFCYSLYSYLLDTYDKKCTLPDHQKELVHKNKVTINTRSKVDNEQLNLEGEDIESIDDTKLSRFIEINSLHFVTEYNPVTVIGLFNSMIQIHLLLMMNKASPEYEESMHRYQKAAKLFQGKILFILVDSGMHGNEKVISFFKLKNSELPALAIYRTLDEEWDTLPVAELSVELVQNFCDGFLNGKRLRENHESEEKSQKVEL